MHTLHTLRAARHGIVGPARAVPHTGPTRSAGQGAAGHGRRHVAELPFGVGDLRRVRGLVADLSREAGLARRRADELTVVVNELAANSVDHAGGHGTIRGWVEPGAVVVEVADRGGLAGSAEGRARGVTAPRTDSERGRGLWIARQLADELEIRAADDDGSGTVVRVVTAR